MTESPLRGLTREEFPSNSNVSKQTEKQKRPAVAKGKLVERKKSFVERFLGDDLNSIVRYVTNDVLLPSVKNILLDSLEMAFFGEIRGKRMSKGSGAPPWYTYVDYSNPSKKPTQGTGNRRNVSSIRSVEEIIFSSKYEAEQVVENMSDILMDNGQIAVGDFFEAAGLPTTSADYSYGWTDVSQVRVLKAREGWYIRMPKEERL